MLLHGLPKKIDRLSSQTGNNKIWQWTGSPSIAELQLAKEAELMLLHIEASERHYLQSDREKANLSILVQKLGSSSNMLVGMPDNVQDG